jgi:hypothetical protein
MKKYILIILILLFVGGCEIYQDPPYPGVSAPVRVYYDTYPYYIPYRTQKPVIINNYPPPPRTINHPRPVNHQKNKHHRPDNKH